MKIITHECPNCGAHLDIKNNHAKGKCPYCRVSYTFNNGVVKTNITNPEVNLAETYLYKFKDYDKSEQIFKKLLINYLSKVMLNILKMVDLLLKRQMNLVMKPLMILTIQLV